MLPRAAESFVIGTDADRSHLPRPRIPLQNISITFIFNNIHPLQHVRPTKLPHFLHMANFSRKTSGAGHGSVFLNSRESFPVGSNRLGAARTRQPEQLPRSPAAFIRPIPSFVTFYGTMGSTKRMPSANASRFLLVRTFGFCRFSSQPVLRP